MYGGENDGMAEVLQPDFCYTVITDHKEFQIKHWYTEPAFHDRTPINQQFLDRHRIRHLLLNFIDQG